MTPFMFGEEQRQLFGILHARIASAPKCGVLICNPFAEEAVQMHRPLRNLADRLCAVNIDVLRFDYFGTGDSGGSDAQTDLQGWIDDILTAHRELVRRTQVSKVVWLGLRVGAIAALQAAAKVSASPAKLLLVDPIAQGRRYLDSLRTQHLSYEGGERGQGSTDFQEDEKFFVTEMIGYEISALLCEQLRAIDFAALQLPPDTTIISDSRSSDGREIALVCSRNTPNVRVVDFPFGNDWMNRGVSSQIVKLLVDDTRGLP